MSEGVRLEKNILMTLEALIGLDSVLKSLNCVFYPLSVGLGVKYSNNRPKSLEHVFVVTLVATVMTSLCFESQ